MPRNYNSHRKENTAISIPECTSFCLKSGLCKQLILILNLQFLVVHDEPVNLNHCILFCMWFLKQCFTSTLISPDLRVLYLPVHTWALAKLQCNVTSNYFCLDEANRLCPSHCSRLLDDAECAKFNLLDTQIGRNLFVISFY